MKIFLFPATQVDTTLLAKEVTLQSVEAALLSMDTKMDGLATEATLQSVDVATGQMNAKMDNLASEATLSSIDISSGVTSVSTANIDATTTAMNATLGTLATELTVASVDAKLDNLATEITAQNIETALNSIDGFVNSIDFKTPSTGQKSMSSSSPVVIASDQSSIPISASSLPLPTGAATETTQLNTVAELSTISTKLDNLATEATLSSLNSKVAVVDTDSVTIVSSALPTGAATEAKQDDLIAAINNAETSSIISAYLTTTPLAGGATYNSGVLQLAPPYTQVQTQILADVNGTVNIYWYTDVGGTDLIRTLSIPYIASSGFQVYGAPAFGPYVKYTYTNGGAAQSDFYFETKFTNKAISPQLMTVDGVISKSMTANLQRSVISGESSAGGGSFVNVKVNPSGTLETNAAQSGTWNINNVSGTVSLPTGAATEATLSSLNSGYTKANAPAYNDYSSTSVTTAAYTQLVASTTSTTKEIEIFDSSGEGMILATGAAASEVDQLFIFPGGNGRVKLAIPAGTRVSIKAKTATASSGFVMINFYG